MSIKEKADPGGGPARKPHERIPILRRLWPRRKPCQCLSQQWNTIADLIALTAELRDELATYNQRLGDAIERLADLERDLWDKMRREA